MVPPASAAGSDQLEKPMASQLEEPRPTQHEPPVTGQVKNHGANELETSQTSQLDKPVAGQLEKPEADQLEKPVTSQLEEPVTGQPQSPVASQLEKPVANQLATPVASQLERPVADVGLDEEAALQDLNSKAKGGLWSRDRATLAASVRSSNQATFVKLLKQPFAYKEYTRADRVGHVYARFFRCLDCMQEFQNVSELSKHFEARDDRLRVALSAAGTPRPRCPCEDSLSRKRDESEKSPRAPKRMAVSVAQLHSARQPKGPAKTALSQHMPLALDLQQAIGDGATPFRPSPQRAVPKRASLNAPHLHLPAPDQPLAAPLPSPSPSPSPPDHPAILDGPRIRRPSVRLPSPDCMAPPRPSTRRTLPPPPPPAPPGDSPAHHPTAPLPASAHPPPHWSPGGESTTPTTADNRPGARPLPDPQHALARPSAAPSLPDNSAAAALPPSHGRSTPDLQQADVRPSTLPASPALRLATGGPSGENHTAAEPRHAADRSNGGRPSPSLPGKPAAERTSEGPASADPSQANGRHSGSVSLDGLFQRAAALGACKVNWLTSPRGGAEGAGAEGKGEGRPQATPPGTAAGTVVASIPKSAPVEGGASPAPVPFLDLQVERGLRALDVLWWCKVRLERSTPDLGERLHELHAKINGILGD